MSRFTMALVAAAAAAIAAVAVVALPAIGDNSNSPAPQVQGDDAAMAAFVTCLRAHGLDGAPGDPTALKPWILRQRASDPKGVDAAMRACKGSLPSEPAVKAPGPEIQAMIDCVRKHGFPDAPTDPVAFKQWLGREEQADPGRVDAALRQCKLALDPGAGKPGAGKPQGDCGAPADKPAPDESAPDKPDEPSSST
jgi:hypothetical protein